MANRLFFPIGEFTLKRHFITTALVLIFSVSASADINYLCTHDSAERKIDVVYTGAGGTVPCEVQYTKSTSYEVLWNAQSEEGFCEAKAAEFVAKQESWGWTCEQVEQTTEQPAAE